MLCELVSVLFRINPKTVRHFLLVDRSKAFPGAPKKMTARTYRKKRYVGIVVDDQSLQVGKSLEKCRHVRSIYQHFCEGKDWCDTEYVELYERRYKRLQSKRKLGSTFEDFCQQKLYKYDSIFEDIREHGFKQSSSLEQNIEIALGPGGQPLLIDGRHRLIFAKILGLASIPVVANLISEQLVRSFATNFAFLSHQLDTQIIKNRLNLLTPAEGGFRNKGILALPDSTCQDFRLHG